MVYSTPGPPWPSRGTRYDYPTFSFSVYVLFHLGVQQEGCAAKSSLHMAQDVAVQVDARAKPVKTAMWVWLLRMKAAALAVQFKYTARQAAAFYSCCWSSDPPSHSRSLNGSQPRSCAHMEIFPSVLVKLTAKCSESLQTLSSAECHSTKHDWADSNAGLVECWNHRRVLDSVEHASASLDDTSCVYSHPVHIRQQISGDSGFLLCLGHIPRGSDCCPSPQNQGLRLLWHAGTGKSIFLFIWGFTFRVAASHLGCGTEAWFFMRTGRSLEVYCCIICGLTQW